MNSLTESRLLLLRTTGVQSSALVNYPPAPEPAGAKNALIRGQSIEKYRRDFKAGWSAECATHHLLTDRGFKVSPVDSSSAMNRHAPDLTVTAEDGSVIPIQVKLASVYGGTVSWVFERRAVEKLTGVLALVETEGAVQSLVFKPTFVRASECRHLMRPLQRAWLNTKVALYKEDL